MQLYKKLSLPEDLVAEIKECTLDEMKSIEYSAMQLYFLKRPQYILGRFLRQNYPDLPQLYNCILFRRPGGYQQPIHLDCNNDDPPEGIHCAINIPLINCDSNYMEWYDGDYEIKVASVRGRDGIDRRHLDLIWAENSQRQCIDRTVIDRATLVRVDVPHAITLAESLRCLVTFRFMQNPEFAKVAAVLP